MREGSPLFGDHSGSILSNKSETSQEGNCRRQPEKILAQSSLGWEKITLSMGEFRLKHPIVHSPYPIGHSTIKQLKRTKNQCKEKLG